MTNFTTEIGLINLIIDKNKLLSLSVSENALSENKSLKSTVIQNIAVEENILVQKIVKQLEQYFTQACSLQDIPWLLMGTPFQQRVWHELTNIPMGKTMSYGELAKKVQSSPRAVGNACRKNPLAIIIPCHRVVSAKGIGGYAGKTEGNNITIKRWLLHHEGVEL